MPPGGAAASIDERMMTLLLVFSSSEPARAAAAAWLSTFDRARANGAAETAALGQAAAVPRRPRHCATLHPHGTRWRCVSGSPCGQIRAAPKVARVCSPEAMLAH